MASYTHDSDSNFNTASTSSRTVNATVSTGLLVVMVTSIFSNAGGSKSVNDVDVSGGIGAMNKAKELTPEAGILASIWTIPVTAGSYTITVTFTAALTLASGCISVGILTDYNSETPIDTYAASDTSSNSDITATIDHPQDGAILYGVGYNEVLPNEAWTLATEIYDRKLTYGRFVGGRVNNAAFEDDHEETVSGWSASTKTMIVAASWETDATDFSLACDVGAFTLTGRAATLTADIAVAYTMIAEAGAYIVTGFGILVARNFREFTRRFTRYPLPRAEKEKLRGVRTFTEWLRRI